MLKKNSHIIMHISNQQIITIISLIAAGVLCRLINLELGVFHIVPIGALALMGGYALKNKYMAILVPILTMFASDIVLQLTAGNGFYDLSQPFVYVGMAIFALLGSNMKQNAPAKVLGNTLLGSAAFWIISNLGVFAAGYYGYSFSGLTQTYTAALPFLKSDSAMLFFNPILVNIIVAQIIFAVYKIAAPSVKPAQA